jgi:hypothetical protein
MRHKIIDGKIIKIPYHTKECLKYGKSEKCEECNKIKKHLEHDIKESEKSIKEDKELERTLGRMR